MYVVIRQNLDDSDPRSLTVLGAFKRAREAAECVAEDAFELHRFAGDSNKHDSEGACPDTKWESVIAATMQQIRECSWRPGEYVWLPYGYIIKRVRYMNKGRDR